MRLALKLEFSTRRGSPERIDKAIKGMARLVARRQEQIQKRWQNGKNSL